MEVKFDTPENITVSGGGLPGTYILEQFHFHWGVNDSEGSEHRIDSRVYAMEVRWRRLSNK